MLCPNCGTLFAEGKICPKCNIDAVLFTKTKNASLKLYNSGLSKAKEGNVSGAIEDLKKSLLFDKTNNNARDLLGLCYFRIGEVADAIKHWIISSSYDPKNTRAKGYIDILNQNTRMLDKYNDAVRQYNKAREYMSQGSTDLAIIQLKKALDYNPECVKALCLYALCCMEEKNYTLAGECIDKALEIDAGCQLALRYRSEMSSTLASKKKKSKAEPEKENRTDYPARAKAKKRYTPGGFDVIVFLAGAVAMTVLLMTLIVPGWVEGKDSKIKELESRVASLQDENENGTSVFAVKYAELEKENEILREENEQYRYNELHSEAILTLKEAGLLAEQNKVLEAGKLLAALDYDSFDDELKTKFDEVAKDIYPVAAIQVCDEGAAFFASSDYISAADSFEMSLKMDSEGDKADDCLYYLGRIAQSKGNKDDAKNYYETLINSFPNSSFVGEVKALIVDL